MSSPRPGRGPACPKLPSLCVDICTLTCDNAEESKVFLHRKSATATGYHDGSLRSSGMSPEDMTLELAKAQVSATSSVPPPSNFGLASPHRTISRTASMRRHCRGSAVPVTVLLDVSPGGPRTDT